MSKQISSIDALATVRKIKKFIFAIFLLGIFVSVFSGEESRADEPRHDPWYYVDDRTYKFSVPDKLQHFYGSAMLTEVVGPMPALAMGLSKEIYDDEYAKVGFSVKDIMADVLGIMSAKFARTHDVSLWLNWNPSQETLVLQFGIRL